MENEMQYLKENKDSSRTNVTQWEWEADRRTNAYVQIHTFGCVVVYRLKA